MKLQVFKGHGIEWYVRSVGGNGETMMTSEGYDSKGNAERAAQNFKNEFDSQAHINIEVIEDEVSGSET
jgi:uncharacterized protein YegP (UPF0339 family)